MRRHVTATAGRSKKRSPLPVDPAVPVGCESEDDDKPGRAAAVAAALVAAGTPMAAVYDMTRGSPLDRAFNAAVLQSGYPEMTVSSWPCELADNPPVHGATILFRDGHDVLYRLSDGALVALSLGWGWARVRVAAAKLVGAQAAVAGFQQLYPATFLAADLSRVPVTFWMYDKAHGPAARLRMIEASPWDDTMRGNYTAPVADVLDGMMTGFVPGEGGQLLLWQGEPGTGKTWALRALVSQWLPWAEFHYITDPDSFFVDYPSYMVDVLLAEAYEAIDRDSGNVVTEMDEGAKWRVLILEDTGELLSAKAKEKYGQGLSRLLNVVDGMIGQGLRVLVLVTTNDELGELNAAVRRQGRCAVQLVFDPLTVEEASAWLGSPVETPMAIADLYALRGGSASAALAADEEARVELTGIASEAEDALRNYWDAHPEWLAHERADSGEDPVAAPLSYWAVELAEPEHADVREQVEAAGGVLELPAAELWIREAENEQAAVEGGEGPQEPPSIQAGAPEEGFVGQIARWQRLVLDQYETAEALRRVAVQHAPEGGYGDTFWNADTATVFWVAADWTSNDEWSAAEEAFLAVEGVERFESEAESAGPEGDEWQQVWPEPDSDLALERATALAARPLTL